MKRILLVGSTVILLIWVNLDTNGQGIPLGKTSYSIFGENRDAVLAASSPQSTLVAASSDVPSGLSPSTSTVSMPSLSTGTPLTVAPPETYDLAVPTTTVQEQAGRDFLDFLESKQSLHYSKDRWTNMRRSAEGYELPVEKKPEEAAAPAAASTATVTAPPPLPPGLAVELPYESQLYISGRKLIGVAYKSTIYDKPDSLRRINSGSFDMTQELQVRIKGRVGRKINVNVDFDDTSQDKRDISVVYKGDPEEFVQEAAFGDIVMSLPSTEFTGYSRQLFGVKLDTKYKGLHTQGFFSRTKGDSEVKRFTGNTTFVRNIISDTSYIAQKYYGIRFNSDSIVNGSMKVYRDDRNPTNNNVTTSTGMVVEVLGAAPAVTYTGDFDLLVPGQDYTVDYQRGFIAFRNPLPKNQVVAIDYQRTDGTMLTSAGTPGLLKVIKYDDTINATLSRELKTFYNLGNVKIIRDNGRGNFILKVVDQNNNAPGILDPGGKTVPQYPQNITVDFENGVFNFEPADSHPFPESLYSVATHNYNILTEYRYRVKFVTLRPGIVPQSERVTLDGQLLRANEDYFIDYDAGIVTFFNEDRINESTVIEVSYDFAPFGGSGGSTLVGLRSELSLTRDIFIGSSFLYNFAARGQTVPDIRTTPSSLLVWEADARTQNIKVPLLPVTMSLSGEYAMSQQNPNIMNKAMVESMEGITQEDSASVIWDSWHPASNPSGQRMYVESISRTDNLNTIVGDITWNNVETKSRDINPNLQLKNSDETQQVLNIDYSLARSNEVSIVQSLSNVGLDFSQKLYLETWVYGDGKGEQLAIAYGSFNEDADGSAVSGDRPKTEDVNGDGSLNIGEDIGWVWKNPDGTTARVGAANGRIDTEDLDADGTLMTTDNILGTFGPAFGNVIVDDAGVSHTNIDWTGWKHIKIPMNIVSPDAWKTVKQIRLTIRGSGQTGNIRLASISAVSDRWKAIDPGIVGSTVAISAINNENNPDYVSLVGNPDYQSLYELQNVDTTGRKEQALSLQYTVPASTGGQFAAYLPYSRAYDLSNYKQFRFFVYGKSANASDTFFIQVGNDTNYYEYSTPVNWAGWRLVTVYQIDPTGAKAGWAVNANGDTSDITGAATRKVGSPSFQNITQIKLGVRTTGPRTGEIWVNEIHVAESNAKTGVAWRGNADFSVPGWGTFGGRRRSIGRDFQTFSAGIYNRDTLEDSVYGNVSRFSFMPLAGKFERSRTVTPSVLSTQNNLVSILDEGRVQSYNLSGSGSLNLNRYLPRFSGQYVRSITDSQQIPRLEDKETISGTMDYDNPLRFALLPTGLSGNYSISNSYFRIYPSSRIIDTDDFLDYETFKKYLDVVDYHTLEITESWGGRAPFQFWPGFTLTPSYNLQTVRQNDNDIKYNYPKAKSQDAGFTSSIRLLPWFAPNVSYAINTRENYSLAYNTATATPLLPAQTKYIERNANGEISWNFQARDVASYKYVQSLGFSSSLRIQNSDSYDNVPSTINPLGVDSLTKLWIDGTPLIDQLSPGTSSYVLKSLVRRNDVRLSGRYNPFEAFDLTGRMTPVRTLSTNFTYTNSEEDSNILSNKKFVVTKVWPDLIVGVNQFERLIWADQWASDGQLTLRHQLKNVLTRGISESRNTMYGSDIRFNLVRKVDMNISFNTNSNLDNDLTRGLMTGKGENTTLSTQGAFNLGLWRFTLRYDRAFAWQKDGTGRFTSDLLTNTYSAQVYSDISFPRGLPLPFVNKTLPLTNRFIFNSAIKYVNLSSSLNVERDNTNTYGLTTSAEYEVSQNFRLSLGLAFNRVENRVQKDESYSTIEGSSRLTIQF